jgi:hypothetical protein
MLCDDNLPDKAQPETGYNHNNLLSCIELTDMTTPATAPHARSRPAHDSPSRAPRPVHPVPCTLPRTPCPVHPVPCTLPRAPCPVHPVPCTPSRPAPVYVYVYAPAPVVRSRAQLTSLVPPITILIMRYPIHYGRKGPPLLLLGALLLFVAGAVIDPFVHRAAGIEPAEAVAGCADEPLPAPAAPADDHSCLLCMLSRAPAQAAPSWSPAAADVALMALPVVDLDRRRPAPTPFTHQPRAPPQV